MRRFAIVGRPNVGKSSLFNRLVGRRVSIVDPTPGVTRDRISRLLEIAPIPGAPEDAEPRYAELVDTGGYGVYTADDGRFDDAGEDLARLTEPIEAQIRFATRDADVILFLVDAHDGLTPLDKRIAELLRREDATAEIVLVANKVDDDSWIAHAAEFASLGFGEPMPASAKRGLGIRDLWALFWNRADGESRADVEGDLRFAIVGRRNAGKSTLVNALAGSPRVIVSEIAGTTRDSVDVRLEIDGRRFTAIDTAGVRKKKSWADRIESFSHQRARDAIQRGEVCVLLLDATQEISQVEKKLAGELVESFKPTIICVNKFDLVEDSVTPDQYVKYLTQELPGLEFAPLCFISAQERDGLPELMQLVANLHAQASHREGTGRINTVIREILAKRGPSSKIGTRAKILYTAQVGVHPPTIVLVVNHPELFKPTDQRYLMNRLRETLPFSEVPIRLVFSERKRMDLSELKAGGRPRVPGGPVRGERVSGEDLRDDVTDD